MQNFPFVKNDLTEVASSEGIVSIVQRIEVESFQCKEVILVGCFHNNINNSLLRIMEWFRTF